MNSLWMILVVFLLWPTWASAEPVTDLTEIIKNCDSQGKNPVKCERDYWSFVDVTGDGQLTPAEITRFGRIFAEYLSQQQALKGEAGGSDNLLYAMLIGPLVAEFLISNFDYDGDHRVSREKLYTDLPEGKFEGVVNRLSMSGNKAIGDAVALVFGGERKGPAKKEGQKKKADDSVSSVLKPLEGLKKKNKESFESMMAKALANNANQQNSLLPMTISEIDFLRQQIGRCWNIPAGAKDAKNLVIEIRIAMNPDGTVNSAKIVDQGRMTVDPFFRSAAESALRAVLNRRCQPFKLPPEKYDIWKLMILSLNPKEIFG